MVLILNLIFMWNTLRLAGVSFHYVMSHLNSQAYNAMNLFCIDSIVFNCFGLLERIS